MFKTACCLLLICTLFMGCNSLQKQTDPVCEKKPAPTPEPKPEPKPEVVTRVIEPALEFAEEISNKDYLVKVKVLETFPHGAPKKLEVTGEQRYVEILEEAALGKKEASGDFFVKKSTLEEPALKLVKGFFSRGLLTSISFRDSEYFEGTLHVSVRGTKLTIRKLSNSLNSRIPAVILAKPVVIERALALLKEGEKIRRLDQKVGEQYVYVEGSQESIDELNKLAEADK